MLQALRQIDPQFRFFRLHTLYKALWQSTCSVKLVVRMNRLCLSLILLSIFAAAQQAGLTPVPITDPVILTSDGAGGVYAIATTGGKRSLVHFSPSTGLRTLVMEEEVGQGELYHSPWDQWLAGDSQRVLFPVFRHVAEFHVAEVMQFEAGKTTPVLPINQKLQYVWNGQSFDRYMVSARGAWLAGGGFRVMSHLANFPVEKAPPLSIVLYNLRPETGGGFQMRVHSDMELEDRSYSSLDPGCASNGSQLFGLGTAANSFFEPASFAIVRVDSEGKRETLATGARLFPGSMACSSNQVSVVFKDSGGVTRFFSADDGERHRAFYEAASVDGIPLGDISNHILTDNGSHLFLMNTPNGVPGVFAIDVQGRGTTLLAAGIAGQGRVVKAMVESAGRLFFLTDNQANSDARVLAFYPAGGQLPSEPRFTAAGVVNGASFEGNLAPGAWASIFGLGLGASTTAAQSIPLPQQLAGVQVLVDGSPAPLQLVSPSQINFQMPWDLGAPAEVSVQVVRDGSASLAARIRIATAAPAIFRAGADGPFLVTTADYKLVDQSNPCRRGEVCILWANGMGRTNQTVVSGRPSPAGAALLDPPALWVNDQQTQVMFAGLAPGLIGVHQINFLVSPESDGSVTGTPVLARAKLQLGNEALSFSFYTQ